VLNLYLEPGQSLMQQGGNESAQSITGSETSAWSYAVGGSMGEMVAAYRFGRSDDS
jgi:hypothetical protein